MDVAIVPFWNPGTDVSQLAMETDIGTDGRAPTFVFYELEGLLNAFAVRDQKLSPPPSVL